MTTQMRQMLMEFQQWRLSHKPLARAIMDAQVFAQAERIRVDEYIRPIFQSCRFLDASGGAITNPRNLDLSDDDAMCLSFYRECDVAHRAHGWTGPEGSCPALAAENRMLAAENELLEAACALLHIKPTSLHGDGRREMLTLLVQACISEGAGNGAESSQS